MKTPGAHAHEDRLLDFAYDELPRSEAQAVERHLQGCPRCTETLQGIRGVRRSMARLPTEAEPSAGLDSLLAYAQQSARRAAAGAEPPPRWWRRLMAPAAGAVAVGVLGIVVLRVNQDVDLRPSLQSAVVEPASRTRPQAATAAAPAMASEASAPSTPMAQAAAAPAPAPVAKPSRMALDARSDKSSDESAKESSRLGLSLKAKSMPSLAGRGGAAKDDLNADLNALSINSSLAGSGAASPEKKSERARDAFAPADADIYDQASAPGALARASRPSQAPAASQPNAAPPPAPPLPPPAGASPAPVAANAAREEAVSEMAPASAAIGGAVSKTAVEPLAQRVSPSPEELMRQADLALRSGDRAREVLFLRAALDGGAHGSQALDALSRLCEAESALGRQHSAIEVCKRVVATAPDSSAARSARRLLEAMLQPSSPGSEAESR